MDSSFVRQRNKTYYFFVCVRSVDTKQETVDI